MSGEKIHRRDIQKRIYDDLGISQDMVIPTYRDGIDKSFTMDEVNTMGDDELNHYFDLGHSVDRSKKGESVIDRAIREFTKPKSSFKEANKKMSQIEGDKYRKYLKESSLGLLWKHNNNHDCAAITAFRKYDNCGYDINGDPCDIKTPVVLTIKEKSKLSMALASDLKRMGYSVTKIVGVYPEGGQSIKESSFFVVDIKNSGSLEKDIVRLGEKYNQDSVLFVPKGSVKGENKAYLIGTNDCCNNWLNKGDKEIFNKGKLGYDSPIYTSYINGRPFIFEDYSITEEIFGSATNAIMADRYSRQIDEYRSK